MNIFLKITFSLFFNFACKNSLRFLEKKESFVYSAEK